MKKFRIFTLALAVLLVLPISASALGQMSQPINITNALRGEQIHQELIAVNGEAKPISAIFTGSGQIKDWVKFYKPNDLKNPVATTTIEAKANLNMIAVFSVPADAANGEYTGLISITSIPDKAAKTDQSSAAMAQKIDRQVTIKVSDTETVKLEASVIPKSYDLKSGEPLSVRIIYDNRSNVSLSPSINFKIKSDDQTVYNVIYPYPESEPAVNPQAIQEIPALEIPTLNLADGKYTAQLAFTRSDKVILEKQFGFSIGTGGLAFATKITDLLKGGSAWLFGLLIIILLAVVGWFYKRSSGLGQDLKKEIKKLKKKFSKTFKTAKSGIAGLF